jgi:EmrB/QacA subfamily drug resistance transporter
MTVATTLAHWQSWSAASIRSGHLMRFSYVRVHEVSFGALGLRRIDEISSHMEGEMADQNTVALAADAQQGATSRGLVVLLTSVAYFMVTLDALVVVTALPSIHRDLGGSIGLLQWTANAYNLAFGAGIITATALGDRFGRRTVFGAGLALFTLASAACALAPNIELLVTFRAVQGIGAATILPLGLTILTSAFPPEKRGAVVGIWGGIAGLGVAAGPLIGGAITQSLSWHWIFWVNVPIGIAAVLGSAVGLRESFGLKAPLDIPALVSITGGVGGLIWGLVEGSQSGWGGSRNLIGLIGGAVCVVAFLVWEARAGEPMIPLRMFRIGTFSSAVAAQLLGGAAIFGAAFLISQYFQFALGNSPFQTGLRFLPWTATPLVIAPLAGSLADRFDARRLVVPGLLLQALGFVWIVALSTSAQRYAAYIVPFFVAGVGISLTLPSIPTAALNAVPFPSLGKAAGILNTTTQFGAVLGIAVVTAVFSARGSLVSPHAVTAGFQPAVLVAAALSLAGAFAALGLRTRRQSETTQVESKPETALTPVGALAAD